MRTDSSRQSCSSSLDDAERINPYILDLETARHAGRIAKSLGYAFPRDFLCVSGIYVFDSDKIGTETATAVAQAHKLGAWIESICFNEFHFQRCLRPRNFYKSLGERS